MNYVFKKYNTSSIFFFFRSFTNNNPILSFFCDNELDFGNKAEPIVFKTENLFFGLDINLKKIKFFKIHETLIFFKIFSIYRLFILLTYVKLLCHFNFLN